MAVDRRARVLIANHDGDHHVVTAPGYAESTGRFRSSNGALEWLAGGEEFKLVEDLWRTARIAATRNYSFQLNTSDFIDATSGAKIGIGSSAALMTALAAAVCDLTGIDEEARSIAFAAHRACQNGMGSGVDIACCSLGGLVEYTMGKGTGLRLDWPEGLTFGLFWSGVPASTSAKLKHLIKSDPRPSRAALAYASKRVASAWGGGNAQKILNEYRDYNQVLGGGDIGIVLASDTESIAAFVNRAKEHNFRHLAVNVDPLGVQVTGQDR
jgi:phosphomevalonate kinase